MNVIKRLLLSCLLILLCASYGAPQQRGSSKVEDSLYYKALLASLDKMSKSWGSNDDSNPREEIRTDYHNVIVEKDYEITEGLPTQLGESHVEYLDSRGLMDRYNKLGKKFSVLIIHAAQNQGTRLTINCSLKWFSYNHKKHGLFFEISGWSNVYFRYDCENRAYVIDEVKLGGV